MSAIFSGSATAEHATSHQDHAAGDVSVGSQRPLDFEAARAARDAGIQTAVDHADAVNPKWSDVAFDYLAGYVLKADTFTSEDVRAAAYASGQVEHPPSERAWGGVFMRAAKAGWIVRAGYDTARDPKVHCNVVTRWRSLVFQGAA